MKRRKTIFDRAGLTKGDFDCTLLVLAVVVAASSDVNTKVKCDRALKGLRKLRRIVNKGKR